MEFNASTEPDPGFGILPAGDYRVRIDSTRFEENTKRNGSYLLLLLSVIEGEYENRIVRDYINLVHKQKTVVQMARGRLKRVCVAAGVDHLKDATNPVELLDRPFIVTLIVKDGWNRVQAFRADSEFAIDRAKAGEFEIDTGDGAQSGAPF